MKNYSCIKNGVVENIIVLDENSLEIIELVKQEHGYDDMIISDGLLVEVGDTYNGTNFVNKFDEIIVPIADENPEEEVRDSANAPALGESEEFWITNP